MTDSEPASFYVVAREPGAEHPALPTWACRRDNPAQLAHGRQVGAENRRDIAAVPGAFQVLGVLDPQECRRLIALSEALGYLPDAAVSLPRRIRHNDNVVWITDADTDGIIWARLADALGRDLSPYHPHRPLGINARFRFYRYNAGDYFKAHSDGAWSGSRVVNGELLNNAYPDRFSQMTLLLFLNDDFDGGATRFVVRDEAGGGRFVDVRTPAGGALCFPHGAHPLHCVHSSEPIEQGVKYIIRSDILFDVETN